MTPAERIAQAEKRREVREKAYAEARELQHADDLEALDKLEDEHGWGRILRIDLDGWQPGSGAVTLIAAKLPLSSDATFKRFAQQSVGKDKKAQAILDSGDAFGSSCVVYPAPDSEAYRATIESFAGVLGHVAVQVVKAVQGRAAEEGK